MRFAKPMAIPVRMRGIKRPQRKIGLLGLR